MRMVVKGQVFELLEDSLSASLPVTIHKADIQFQEDTCTIEGFNDIVSEILVETLKENELLEECADDFKRKLTEKLLELAEFGDDDGTPWTVIFGLKNTFTCDDIQPPGELT